jgi:hypothetical protein
MLEITLSRLELVDTAVVVSYEPDILDIAVS